MSENYLQDVLIETDGYLFNNLTVNGIKYDRILVNNSGIFVIKEFEVNKFLTGKADDDNLYEYKDKKQKKPYLNPVKINEENCYKLASVIEGVSSYMVNLVVFINDNCDLIDSDNVFNLEEVEDLLMSFDEVYSDIEVFKIVDILNQYVNPND